MKGCSFLYGELQKYMMNDSDEFKARAGWHIHMVHAVQGKLENHEIESLLQIIKAEMKAAPLFKQETMNRCLVEIVLNAPEWIAAVLAKKK